ncbi:hypothetical protein AgCh_022150 [Apium graveolens]
MDKVKLEPLSETCVSTDSDYLLKDKGSMDKIYPSKELINSPKLEKLNEKYGPVRNNFVIGECSKDKQQNIGHIFNKQLEDKVETMIGIKKRNKRNGKI